MPLGVAVFVGFWRPRSEQPSTRLKLKSQHAEVNEACTYICSYRIKGSDGDPMDQWVVSWTHTKRNNERPHNCLDPYCTLLLIHNRCILFRYVHIYTALLLAW